MKKRERSKLDMVFPFITVALVIGGAIFLGILSGKGGGGTLGELTVVLDNSQAHFKGAEEAKIILTEFSDFQCPACREIAPRLKKISENYPQEVKLFYRHFPLPQHTEAQKAAEAAEAAGEQGKFWEMHDKIFDNQENIKVADIEKYASELGLDMAQFNEALDSSKYRSKVLDDKNEGQKIGVNATPTVFLNGRKLSSSDLGNLSDLIEKEIGKTNE